MLINDVGASTWEEINEGVPGVNFGWPNAEGPAATNSYRDPLLQYGHGIGPSTGCAIVGAAFYNPAGRQFPRQYDGNYFFADYCSGWIRRLDTNNLSSDFITGAGSPVDLKVGPDGTLYCLSLVHRTSGSIYRIGYQNLSRFQSVRRLMNDRIQLHIVGGEVPCILETSMNLADWIPIFTNTVPALEFDFYDDGVSNSAQRFYRLTE